MASVFEILLLRDKNHHSKDASVRLSLTTTTEADKCLDNLLEPFGRSSFELIEDLNKSFRKINFWPWAIITFAHEYRLAGHVSATRHSRKDVVFSGYSVQDGYSVVRDGPPPMSMLFFHSKSVVSTLASRSPLFSACWSVLADKPKNKNWLCVPQRIGSRKLRKEIMYYSR
jgi:hypothetical protein